MAVRYTNKYKRFTYIFIGFSFILFRFFISSSLFLKSFLFDLNLQDDKHVGCSSMMFVGTTYHQGDMISKAPDAVNYFLDQIPP
jgi:hypothetical protein